MITAGHQFGNFAGQLGDGAAMYLGEILSDIGYEQNSSTPVSTTQSVSVSESDNNHHRWELQLKGAGLTPYSRTADGRKVLRSSIREFLCSEAMYYLGIPTTRAGSLVTSDSTVERDPFYDGNSIDERCTIVSRIAPNFFRFGSFEIFKSADPGKSRAGPSAGNAELKKRLLDHVLTYYPSIQATAQAPSELLREVVKRTAELVALWQAAGWVHGVLNTDNLSIMGLTIDFGPFGFMEHYDSEYVPNGSDNSGRYCYEAQPQVRKLFILVVIVVLLH